MTINGTANTFMGALVVAVLSTGPVACSKTLPAASEKSGSTTAAAHDSLRREDGALPDHRSDHKSPSRETPRGKPGAAVRLASDRIYGLDAGVAGDLTLILDIPYTEGKAHVMVSTSEGLTIVSGVTEHNFLLDADTDYAVPLELLATENGRYYVHLQVNIETETRRSFKALSAIVQVGPEARAMSSQRAMKADAESPGTQLPAEETIIVE